MAKIDEYKTWFDQGVAFLETKDYEKAHDYFQKSIDIQPDFIPAWVYKGISLERLQRYEDAIQCYSQAIKINPNAADLWYNQGTTYCIMRRYQDALTCFDKVLEIEPNNALAKTTRFLVINKPSIIELTPKKPEYGRNKEAANSEEVEVPKVREKSKQSEFTKFQEKQIGE